MPYTEPYLAAGCATSASPPYVYLCVLKPATLVFSPAALPVLASETSLEETIHGG